MKYLLLAVHSLFNLHSLSDIWIERVFQFFIVWAATSARSIKCSVSFFCSQQIPLRSVRKFLHIQFLKVRLHRLPLAPVIEDDHLLAELPLVVLHVVPVQDGESHYEGGGYGQHRDHHWTHVCWHHSEIIRNNFSSLQANAFQFRVKILFILTLLTHKVFVYISCSVSPANDWLSATRNTLHHLSSCLAVSCEAREKEFRILLTSLAASPRTRDSISFQVLPQIYKYITNSNNI